MIRKCLLGLLLLAPLGLYPLLRGSDGLPLDLPVHNPPPALTHNEKMEKLAAEDPIKFLETCMSRYENEVQAYRCIFAKQEKVAGKLLDKEKLLCHFREKPFSVHMRWLEGKDRAVSSMYVEGENGGKLLARPCLFGVDSPVILSRPVNAADVKMTSRFPITEFGIQLGTKSTLGAMRAAKEKDILHIRYEGIQKVEQLGGRLCYKFVRTPYTPPESDNVNELIIYVDQELLMQTGSILKDPDGNLIAEYFFCDIDLNPKFDDKQFTRAAL